ncbi:hypothetical protein SAMN04490193_4117 [Pseudomonas marginalis]|nr:hypothetical protein SAMN04490193_4117 [Pseudomonas marginalis]SMF07846.1 hypothetical protein SAMN05660912_01407 [Pseudomonas sp. LAMO17WK12:I1]
MRRMLLIEKEKSSFP